jgi:hypothetical protein
MAAKPPVSITPGDRPISTTFALVSLVLMIGGIVIVAMFIYGAVSNPSRSDNSVVACSLRGIEYFKEIDAFPTLSDGRDAGTVAMERCNRRTTAFP